MIPPRADQTQPAANLQALGRQASNWLAPEAAKGTPAAKKTARAGAKALGGIPSQFTAPFGGMFAVPGGAAMVEQARQQHENAGGVTTSNAPRVARSQAAPADTLMAASRAVKAYKASPDYIENSRTSGRLLNETDLSPATKQMLVGLGASDQKRLLGMIHRHGEQQVLAAAAQQAAGNGKF